MRARDVAAGMRLKNLAGWNQVEADWRLFLKLSPSGCLVAVHGDRIVGTITSLNHGHFVSWLSMLLVDPAFRGMGIGTRLMREAIENLGDRETIKLDATPLGQPIYERLGFRDEYGLMRVTIGAMPDIDRVSAEERGYRPRPRDVTPIAERPLEPILELDRRVFGDDRGPLLDALRWRTPKMAWLVVDGGHTRGFCMGRHGTEFTQVGPLVAESVGDAIALCRAVMRGLAGRAVVLDVPVAQVAFLQWLYALGFAEQRPLTRMYRGANRKPGLPAQQFAIAGPELG